MLGLCVDNLLSTVWMHSNKKMYTLDYSQEKSNIWIAYFKKGRYKDALELCRDQKSISVISGCVGDQCFSGGSYDLSVDYYIKSNKTFEEVSLKFLSKNLHSHLCKYLEKFLDKIKKQELRIAQMSGGHGSDNIGHVERYRPQKILLSTWIVELKLNEINDVKTKFEIESAEIYDKDSYNQSIEQLEKYLWQFLDENFTDKNEIDHILQNHGRINENAKSPKDFINRKMYRQALDCVKQIGDNDQRFKMMKKYCLIFLQKDLEYTLETLRSSKFNKMDFSELVPSFADVSANHEDKISLMLEFLREHCIERLKCQDKIIHNLAFYFMTRLDNLEPMISYLQFLESCKEQKRIIGLDLEYAFNQCRQGLVENRSRRDKDNLERGQIIIYAILGLFEKAVDLSLNTENYDLAKKYASKSFIDKKLKKNLWLRIAKKILKQV